LEKEGKGGAPGSSERKELLRLSGKKHARLLTKKRKKRDRVEEKVTSLPSSNRPTSGKEGKKDHISGGVSPEKRGRSSRVEKRKGGFACADLKERAFLCPFLEERD